MDVIDAATDGIYLNDAKTHVEYCRETIREGIFHRRERTPGPNYIRPDPSTAQQMYAEGTRQKKYERIKLRIKHNEWTGYKHGGTRRPEDEAASQYIPPDYYNCQAITFRQSSRRTRTTREHKASRMRIMGDNGAGCIIEGLG